MKWKSYIGMTVVAAILCTAIGAYAVTTPVEPEETLKTALFSAEYEGYLPSDWFKTAKLNSVLTRTDAAYLAVNMLAKASGTSVEWMGYKTELKDTQDKTLSRAVDLGLLSVGRDLKFNGKNPVTQQEMAVVMTKVLIKLKAYQKPTKALTFKDQSKIAPWAKESVQYLAEKQWLVWVKDGKFEPTKPMTVGRAVALSDSLLTSFKVYEKPKAVNPAERTFDINGFKVPLPTASELEISVNADKQLVIFFSGNIKNRSQNTYKSVTKQLIELLNSGKVSYDARSQLIQALTKNWDATTQAYAFGEDQYISLDKGILTNTKPSGSCLFLEKGTVLRLVIIQ